MPYPLENHHYLKYILSFLPAGERAVVQETSSRVNRAGNQMVIDPPQPRQMSSRLRSSVADTAPRVAVLDTGRGRRADNDDGSADAVLRDS